MGLILCATRGGEASYRSQQAAIALAKERNDEIVFLYIINLSFLDKTSAPIVVNIENELEQMGRFFLLMAKERATEQGVKVRTLIRRGTIREEIINAARDEGATLVVLGRPTGEQSAFEMSGLREFMDEIQRETGAETQLV
ncbi:MAG TPA: universal stress protein [Anaerolineales bacterium]|jgi:nucleotide-binding universal stress UspA family protein|nr:universal stress protein [Anaerolineales bacterium]